MPMERDSALKRKEILTPAATWMSLADTVCSAISQPWRDEYYVILLLWGAQSCQNQTEGRVMVVRGWGRGEGGVMSRGYRFRFTDEKGSGEEGGNDRVTLWMYLLPRNCTLEMVKISFMCILPQLKSFLKRWTLTLSLTQYQKMNLKWKIDLPVRANAVPLLEENT